MDQSFHSWLRRRHDPIPQADKIMPLVAAAGPTGMTRGQIGHAVALDRDVLDELLDGLVRSGLLVVGWENEVMVFRTPG